jgi:ABC-2 type transport system permease protein
MASADSLINNGGVIHDIGYRRYTGARLGRRHIVTALYLHSLRTAFGLGRSAKAKIFPGIVALIAFGVAVIAVAIRSQSGEIAISYLYYTSVMGIPVLLFLAVVAPELVCRDLRAQVLPLYFSRPLRRADYAVAKVAAMISAVWLLLAGPLLLMFLGGVFAQTGGASGARHEFTDFLGGLAWAAIAAAVLGAVAMPLASWTSRRAVSAVVIVSAFLVTTPVIGVVDDLGGDTARQLVRLVNPLTLLDGLQTWIFRTSRVDIGRYGSLYLVGALALVGGCVALLIVRYRKVAA